MARRANQRSAAGGVIGPGGTIGFLGGGQLGRMTALAARAMGYRIHVMDPDPNCSTAPVADRVVAAKFNDAEAARDIARNCDVVTLEIEQIAGDVLRAASAYAPTRPGATAIEIIQDRAAQKQWLSANGFPLGAWEIASDEATLRAALTRLPDSFVKSCRGGYDGRSQVRVDSGVRTETVWSSLGGRPAVVEKALDLAGEVSVMVARRPGGGTAVFPVSLNHHQNQVLAWSVTPAPLDATLVKRATDLGRSIAESLRIEGVLAIEMFLTTGGELLVNELAPRPHNSFHTTERSCVTSQFEQLVRAVCDLPLGDTAILRPAAIVNLFGDLWENGNSPEFARVLETRGARVHLYGKAGARKGRKMGHISAIGGSSLEALEAARGAARDLGVATDPPPASLTPFFKRAAER